ncbi:hypothetical protein [Morganella sp. GD04133]|uniref:hypothetical protein n=1 Tax=Morganella sp. GD04133 TaxID=2975435 RepID=UPI00244CFCE5|nr:hypothetical protein [Morganella sp. GD04133]MDH0354034.1 hypothetical protein [Morganella sp. GD04133]
MRSAPAIRNLTLTFLYIGICAKITSDLVTQGFDRGSHLVRSVQFTGFVLHSFTSTFLYIKIMRNPASCLTDKGFVMVRTCPHFAHNTDTCEPETFIDFLRCGGDLRTDLPYQPSSSGKLVNINIYIEMSGRITFLNNDVFIGASMPF